MISIIGLYILGSVTSPMEGDIWSVNNTYTIEWNSQSTVHVQLEMYDGYWKTDINKLNFLSTIADDFSYDWNIPIYLSQYWHYPKRIKLTDVEMVDNWYSGVFNTTGLSIDYLNITDNTLSLNWTTNLDNVNFNVYLYDNETTYFNYNDYTPEYYLASNFRENVFTWELPYGINNNYVVIVETTNNLVMDISDDLFLSNIASTTVSTTVTSSLIPFIPPRETGLCEGADCAGWIVLFIFIAVFLIACVYCFVSTSCFWCSMFQTANKIYPRSCKLHIERPCNPVYISPKNRNTGAIQNVVYNDNTYGEFTNTSSHYYHEPDDIETLPSTPPLEPFPMPPNVYVKPNYLHENTLESDEDNSLVPPPRGGVYNGDDDETEMVCLSKRYSSYGVNSPPPPTCWERPPTPKKYTSNV